MSVVNFHGKSRPRRYLLGVSPLELWRETLADLGQNKLRSALTMLGIAWGVASLVILVAMGDGMGEGMRVKNETLGKNILIVWGGTICVPAPGVIPGKDVSLLVEDAEAIRRECPLIIRISPEIARGDMVSASASNRGNFDVHGALPEYQAMRSITVERGRLLGADDEAMGARVCLIGDQVDKQLFSQRCKPGDALKLAGVPFRVVGVLSHKDQNGNYSGPDNSKIFIPLSTMRRDFPIATSPFGDRFCSNIIAQAPSAEAGEAAEVQVRNVLSRRHNFDPADKDASFIWNTATQARIMAQMFGALNLFMGFVAAVTLALGGIGVMNIMLVSVRSRTKEIGLRKSLGATRQSIMALFFLEAILVSLVSGLMGFAGAMGLSALVNCMPLPDFFAGLVVTPLTGGLALGFLLLVSLAAAFYPSYSAAWMDPVEALRFEE